MTDWQNGLPSGWDRKWDENAGKYYYVDHSTKTTTWEDPRTKSRSSKQFSKMQGEHIPLEMRSATKSPVKLKNSTVQESSFTSPPYSSTDSTEDSVTKISAMFPTVSETHIKLLLKKYLNREALVISALQVEKYPITTPGPFSTPPPQRNIQVNGKVGQISRTGSPLLGGFARSSPKPHSSPKLKLRYMKSIFPNADETIILECLQNNESSIQKTSEILKEMGYSKKETVKIATPKVEPKILKEDEIKAGSNKDKIPVTVVQIKSNEEKNQMKIKLQELYKDVPEHLIAIALESVNFNENRANQILQIMKQEDNETQNTKNQKPEEVLEKVDAPLPSTSQIPISQSRQSIKSILKSEKKEDAPSFSRIIDGNNKSTNLTNTLGHNINFSKGPNEKLLLDNYVQWQGSNKSFQKGPQSLAKGPNRNLISTKYYSPCGPNADFRKGPSFGLSKGSIFRQMLVNLE
ncbi:unnamed protein product [Ceutorhynchus assimilis]|uniref:WW domain-containing protein n=1 Tax=Ceutorhynchus assimilis TaxID=467358 RepID=A0A9N9MGB2_9CUCU|nr:unnamed protein product [Ceutorhynchus assimilis]